MRWILKKILPALRGRRTRIAYDATYPAISLLFHHTLSYFSSSQKIIFAIYSDKACRRLRETYKSLLKEPPEVAKVLEECETIKIGQKKCSPFKDLCSKSNLFFMPEDVILDDYAGLRSIAEKVSNEDVLVLIDFYLLPMIYGRKILRSLYRMFDALPEEVTVFSLYSEGFLDNSTNKAMEKLYDYRNKNKKRKRVF